MNIESIDRKCRITLARVAEADWPSFHIEAHIDIGHGRFMASNQDVVPINWADFVQKFDQFLLDRRFKLQLDGTYGTFLSFHNEGRATLVGFRIGDAFAGYASPTQYALSGAFEIEEETLLPTLTAFRQLPGD